MCVKCATMAKEMALAEEKETEAQRNGLTFNALRETGSCRWLGQVFVVFRMAVSHMQSIPFVSASQAERRCTTL